MIWLGYSLVCMIHDAIGMIMACHRSELAATQSPRNWRRSWEYASWSSVWLTGVFWLAGFGKHASSPLSSKVPKAIGKSYIPGRQQTCWIGFAGSFHTCDRRNGRRRPRMAIGHIRRLVHNQHLAAICMSALRVWLSFAYYFAVAARYQFAVVAYSLGSNSGKSSFVARFLGLMFYLEYGGAHCGYLRRCSLLALRNPFLLVRMMPVFVHGGNILVCPIAGPVWRWRLGGRDGRVIARSSRSRRSFRYLTRLHLYKKYRTAF